MEVKLYREHFFYIRSNIDKSIEHYLCKSVKENSNMIIINLDSYRVDEIRDWACKRLDIVGFDENYELTEEGKILDEIIDIFFLN